jgi:hypothetical protein
MAYARTWEALSDPTATYCMVIEHGKMKIPV